jgi:hypothetical protein
VDEVAPAEPLRQVVPERRLVEPLLRRGDEPEARPRTALRYRGTERHQVVRVLQQRQEERLRFAAERLHLVQEERSPVREEELSSLGFHRAREGALNVADQLAPERGRVHRQVGAVDVHEAPAPAAQLVDAVRDVGPPAPGGAQEQKRKRVTAGRLDTVLQRARRLGLPDGPPGGRQRLRRDLAQELDPAATIAEREDEARQHGHRLLRGDVQIVFPRQFHPAPEGAPAVSVPPDPRSAAK